MGVDVRAFGALVNGVAIYDASMTVITGTTATISAPDANFSQADVGKICSALIRATGNQYARTGTITAVASATSCTVTLVTTTNNGSIIFVYGTDDTVAVQAALTYSGTQNCPATVRFPTGICMVSAALTIPDRTSIAGTGNTPGVDYSYNWRYSGSALVYAGAYINGAFMTLGTIGPGASYAPTLRFINIDGFMNCLQTVYAYNRACHIFSCTITRGAGRALNGGLSMVVLYSTFFNDESGGTVGLVSDTRFVNNYVFGAGSGIPAIQISGDDVVCQGNHMWRDSDVDVPGSLIQVLIYDGSTYGGAITICENAFDTDVKSNVEINLSNNSSLRTLNIYGNHSLENDLVSTNASATFNATFNGTTTMVVNSVATGFLYQGAVITGTGIGANVYIVSQSTGTAGAAGNYTISATVATATESVSAFGYPYVLAIIGSGSNVRMLSIQTNSAHGSFGTISKGPMACLLDVSQNAGNIYSAIITGNICDDTAIGYAGPVGGSFSPTIGTNANLLIRNSASTTPVTF